MLDPPSAPGVEPSHRLFIGGTGEVWTGGIRTRKRRGIYTNLLFRKRKWIHQTRAAQPITLTHRPYVRIAELR